MVTKDRVLEKLENVKGSFISGGELALEFGISRNAVWKAVSELKKEGYDIESVSNKGYRLNESCDIISQQSVKCELRKQGFDADKVDIIVHERLDSTNVEAKKLLLNPEGHFKHGTVIVARTQTSGKGHGGDSFESPEGGIYLSIILEPDSLNLTGKKVPKLAVKAVKNSLEKFTGKEITLKENSRLYIGRRKVSGILTEGIVDMETQEFSNYIVGIGIIPVNQVMFSKHSKSELIAYIVKQILN